MSRRVWLTEAQVSVAALSIDMPTGILPTLLEKIPPPNIRRHVLRPGALGHAVPEPGVKRRHAAERALLSVPSCTL
eukprot:5932235-Pyramimonas_sp.AAC.1